MPDADAALARCEREIAALEAQDHGDTPAWLVMLGIEDWIAEMEFLRRAQ